MISAVFAGKVTKVIRESDKDKGVMGAFWLAVSQYRDGARTVENVLCYYPYYLQKTADRLVKVDARLIVTADDVTATSIEDGRCYVSVNVAAVDFA